MVITITHQGYVKRTLQDNYKSQRRGGRGITAMGTKEKDFVRHLFVASTHHYFLFFTNKGKVYRLKVHEIPEASRQAKGTAIVNLLNVDGDDKITTVIPVREFSEDQFLFMVTRRGFIKKTPLNGFDTSRRDGIIALSLEDGDELVDVKLTGGSEEILLGTKKGLAIRFPEADVRSMGRTARGVKGISLSKKDEVVVMETVREDAYLLTVTANGYGKRTSLSKYRVQSRAGKGIINIRTTTRNGPLVTMQVVREGEEVMMISAEGIIIRLQTEHIPSMGRTTQGVTLMRINPGDAVVAVAKVVGDGGEEGEEEAD